MRRWTALLGAVVLVGLGLTLLSRSGVSLSSATVDGVPMLEAAPAQPRGGVVVVHGFAGSARLMRGFADTLVDHGYAVVIPDLAGHGTSTSPLPSLSSPVLDDDIAAAVARLQSRYALPLDRIALVGHSMGATAVTRYAFHHPAIAATVAISLGSADDLPEHLLVVTGGSEFPGFRAAADAAVAQGRSAVTIPFTEHISVLYATQTHRETARWIDSALGGSSPSGVHPRDRLIPAGILLLGLALGFVPLTALLLPVSTVPSGEPGGRWLVLAMGTGIGLAAAIALAPFLPTNRLPLAVGGYTSGFFLVVGVSLAISQRRFGRPTSGGPRTVLIAAVLALYAAAAVAVPIHLGFTNAVPTGTRWWLLPIVVGAAWTLLLGVERTERWWAKAGILAATTVALTAAALVGFAPGFIVLVIPLLAVLFGWHLAWAQLLGRRAAPPWVRALVGAVLVAWPIATSLPIVA